MEYDAFAWFSQVPTALLTARTSVLPCAWCMVEQGLDLGKGSHGMCQRHAIEARAIYRERRQQRREVRV